MNEPRYSVESASTPDRMRPFVVFDQEYKKILCDCTYQEDASNICRAMNVLNFLEQATRDVKVHG